MKVLLILSVLCCTSFALLSEEEISNEWNKFKLKYRKYQFRSFKDETVRKTIFEKNLLDVEDHNERYRKGLETYEKGINQFADYTEEELRPYTNGLLSSGLPRATVYVNSATFRTERALIPDTLNWTESGIVGPVKNQGSCGACWAFGAIASIEARYNLRHGTNVTLSEQQLLDCTRRYSCGGGRPDGSFEGIFEKGGVNYDTDYPYEEVQKSCRYDATKPHVSIRSYAKINGKNEETMKKVVATQGPITVAIYANKDFMQYKDGVFYSTSCADQRANHIVLVTGYGTENGQDYWLVKNSWGEYWGLKGYGKMARNRNNHCWIANEPVYPLL